MDPLIERLVACAFIGAVLGLAWEVSFFRFVLWGVLSLVGLYFVSVILIFGVGELVSQVNQYLFPNRIVPAFAAQVLVGFFLIRILASMVRTGGN